MGLELERRLPKSTIAFPEARARLNRLYALPSEVTNTCSHDGRV